MPEPEAHDKETPEEPSPPPKKEVSNLAVRLLTAAVGIPIILWMLFYGHPVVFSAFSLVVALVGGHELAGMTLKGEGLLKVYMVLATMAVTATLVFVPTGEALVTLMLGIVILGPLATLARPDPLREAGAKMAWLIAGPVYIGGAIAAIAKLHHLSSGGTWVVLSMALAWGSDTGGYFAGKAFGKHKLYEKVSPKKTIEGSIGGLVAIVLMALVAKVVWLDDELSILHAVVLALVAGAAGQAGDLCVSVIKRSTAVKDTGFIIPGHGGLLDRIDALMFTASITLLYTHWVLGLPAQVPALW